MTSTTDLRAVGLLVGLICLAAIGVFVVVPALVRFTTWFEALSLLVEGLGEYTGHHRLAWLGCVALFLGIAACCVVTLVLAGALLTCNASNPAQLCRLIGR